MNSLRQMEQFDTKIFYFSGLNRYQQQVSLYHPNPATPLSLSSLNQGKKISVPK